MSKTRYLSIERLMKIYTRVRIISPRARAGAVRRKLRLRGSGYFGGN